MTLPENSSAPRHRRQGNTTLALAGVAAVIAIAGAGVALALPRTGDHVTSAASPATAHLRDSDTTHPRDGDTTHLPDRAATARSPGGPPPESMADDENATGTAAPDGAGQPPQTSGHPDETGRRGHEESGPPSPGPPPGAMNPPRFRPAPPAASIRHGGGDANGPAARTRDRETPRSRQDRPRQARTAQQAGQEPETRPAGRNATSRKPAARASAAQDPAALSAAARDRPVARPEADGPVQAHPQDPCLRFDDLRRDYCYEVLSRLAP